MKENNTNIEKLILDATEAFFLQKGFRLTSTTEIATKAWNRIIHSIWK